MAAPQHVYEMFVNAPPERVWQAITDPEFTRHYFHRTAIESTFEPGSPYRLVLPDGATAVEGVIEEFDDGHRLVMTWRVLYDPDLATEPPSRVEWTVVPANESASVTRVTLRHRDLASSPGTWASVRLGWVGVLHGLKTFVETGEELGVIDAEQRPSPEEVLGDWHRSQAVEANNSAWDLLDGRTLTADEADELLHRAHTAAYHWARATGASAEHAARAEWLLSRAACVAGETSPAIRHAERCASICDASGLVDFDRAYAHEAKARAFALAGDLACAESERATAAAVVIADPEDRAIFEADLAAEPWFGLRAGFDSHPTTLTV